jgi:hypothetical protein
MTKPSSSNAFLAIAAIVVAAAIIVLAPIYLAPTYAFTVVLLTMVGLCGALGSSITGRWNGVLIGACNTMSLTRFQIVFWTCIILSAFITLSLGNLSLTPPTITPPLLMLMGISLASGVGGSVIASNKATQQPPQGAMANALANTPDDAKDQATNSGILFKNSDPAQASLTDMFEGDELADQHLVDITKVQMFFFTLVAGALFLSDMYGKQLSSTTIALPDLPQQLVNLMGISHAAYLGGKAVTKTSAVTQPQPQVQAQAQLPGGGPLITTGLVNTQPPAAPPNP